MKLTELLEKINEGKDTFEVSDLRLDEDGDLWLYDPEQKTSYNLCRDAGRGWVIVYEDWGTAEESLFNEFPNTFISIDDENIRVDLGTGLGESLYPRSDWNMTEIFNHLMFEAK